MITQMKNVNNFQIPYRKKKIRHKISSVKKIVGKKFRHWPNNSSLLTAGFFFAWLSENINGIKKTLISYLDHSLFC